tara:strand:- start:932 stop:1417 length:486 start_codon:yes stop_codon:yes gene_type:complete
MKNICVIFIIFLVTSCNEKESQLTGKADVKSIDNDVKKYVPKVGAVNASTMDLNPEGLFCLKGSDIPYTGKTFSLWPNGNIEAEGNMKNGRPDGLVSMWYETGEKAGEGAYKDNKRDGILIEWHKNGNKKMEQNFDAGNLLSDKFWDKEGNEVDSYEDANK